MPVAAPQKTDTPRHTALVRVTHWITVVCFFALLITGAAIANATAATAAMREVDIEGLIILSFL